MNLLKFKNWHKDANFKPETFDAIIYLMREADNFSDYDHEVQDELLIHALIGLCDLIPPEYQEAVYDLIAAYDKTKKWYT